MTDSIPYLVPTYFQELIFPAITPPKIPALLLTLFLFRHMHRYKYILFRQQILLYVLQCFSKRKSVCVICLSENQSVCLGIFLSVYPSICISVYLDICLSV
jgi:hypothetical protein